MKVSPSLVDADCVSGLLPSVDVFLVMTLGVIGGLARQWLQVVRETRAQRVLLTAVERIKCDRVVDVEEVRYDGSRIRFRIGRQEPDGRA
jgi:hypothetical protein